MKLTKEMIEKAKAAKTAEELLELAKAEGVELTAKEAEKTFVDLHKTGELADEELDNVAGGWCDDPADGPRADAGVVDREEDVVHLYHSGDQVEVLFCMHRHPVKLIFPYVERTDDGRYEPYYSAIDEEKDYMYFAQSAIFI